MKVKVDVHGAVNGLKSLTNIGSVVENQIAKDAAQYFHDITPIKTGNARRNTFFNSPNMIEADYPYAEKLDGGSSKQAPAGMSKPTEEFIKRAIGNAVNQALQRKGR